MERNNTHFSTLIDEFSTMGYCILRQAISDDIAFAAQEEADRVCSLYPSLSEADRSKDVVLLRHLSEAQREGINVTDDTPYIFGNLPKYSTSLTQLLIHPVLQQLTEALLGCAEPQYHFSNLTIKAAGVGPTIRAHRDFPNKYYCPTEPIFLRVLLCLDAMDAANGATTIAVGSHLHEGNTDEMNEYAIVTAQCNAGDALFLHPRVLHGGGGNRSSQPRRLMVAQWGAPTKEYLYRTKETFTEMTAAEIRRRIE